MVSNFIGSYLEWCRIKRLLILLSIAVIASFPVLDAYLDSFYNTSAVYQDINDSDDPVLINDSQCIDVRNLRLVSKRSSKKRVNEISRAQLVSRINGPTDRITKPQLPANDSCFSQRSSFVSSDPSPPVS
jgi:hypothetical protein